MTHFRSLLVRNLRFGVLAATLTLAPGTVALGADGVCDGTISSQALRPLPAATAFDVEVYDNSEENLKLRERFLTKLRQAGIPTDQGGPLMIAVISERLFPRYRHDNRAVGTPTTSATTSDLGVNRARSTIKNLDRAPKNAPAGINRRYEEQIEVRFEVRDTQLGSFVWLAQLSCSPLTDLRSEIIDTVLDAFVTTVGQTVTDQPLK